MGSLVVAALVVSIWASNQGSALQTVFLWMVVILVATAIAGVQIMLDARRVSGRDS